MKILSRSRFSRLMLLELLVKWEEVSEVIVPEPPAKRGGAQDEKC